MSKPIREYTPYRDQQRTGFSTVRLSRRKDGPWIYVVDSPSDPLASDESPVFQNGWTNMGGDWQILRFRWLQDGTVEIEGVVTGGALGTVIFTLPDSTPTGESLYWRIQANDGDIPVAGVNIADFSHAGFKIAVNGEVSFEA